jgi:hypothetical protein
VKYKDFFKSYDCDCFPVNGFFPHIDFIVPLDFGAAVEEGKPAFGATISIHIAERLFEFKITFHEREKHLSLI